MWLLISAFVVAVLAALCVVCVPPRACLTWRGDRDPSGLQNLHALPVPRIGDLGVAAGLAVLAWRDPGAARWLAILLGCALPAFLGGMAEDLTKTHSPRRRLALAAVSAGLAGRLLQAAIARPDIPGVIALLALAGVGAVFGFFVWNFPAGLVFLGDGGAYFLGVYVAELAIPLLLCICPVFETLFSIYRKRYLRGMSRGLRDGVHFHMLVYKRLMRWAVGDRSARQMTRRNSMTSPYLWMLCSMSVVPALLWFDSTAIQAGFIVLFGATYLLLYWRIVRFRAPRWLVFRQPK